MPNMFLKLDAIKEAGLTAIDVRRVRGQKRGTGQLCIYSNQQLRGMKLVERDGDTCCYCHVTLDDRNRTIEHVIPLAKRGGDGFYNLRLSCQPCNVGKSLKDAQGVTFDERLEILIMLEPLNVEWHGVLGKKVAHARR